jgi:hypothetical protein
MSDFFAALIRTKKAWGAVIELIVAAPAFFAFAKGFWLYPLAFIL